MFKNKGIEMCNRSWKIKEDESVPFYSSFLRNTKQPHFSSKREVVREKVYEFERRPSQFIIIFSWKSRNWNFCRSSKWIICPSEEDLIKIISMEESNNLLGNCLEESCGIFPKTTRRYVGLHLRLHLNSSSFEHLSRELLT